ncbi:MAG: carbonate dehydratase [Fibrobacteres bacterium]|nr:carbonate dehydratase [Fibrobacterota bacterium]
MKKPNLKQLFSNNRLWAREARENEPGFFKKLVNQHNPEYLWIGCADSRVPANEIVGLMPGELFVHRNIANVVVHTDLNCLSVLQYAVELLKVKHIIVCGHYGCGGVTAALQNRRHGLVDNWLCHIQDVYRKHHRMVDALSGKAKVNKMCELNVIEQVKNVCQTTVLQEAWTKGLGVSVHGWIYGIENGLLKNMNITVSRPGDVSKIL